MEGTEINGAGIETIAYLWEAIFNSLGESASSLKGLGPLSLGDAVLIVAPLLQAATFAVLLCLHCAFFTLAIVHPRGSLCLVPRPCEGSQDVGETELRCIQWACLLLYLMAFFLLNAVVAPVKTHSTKGIGFVM
ncbi:hypothetical protein cyc_04450 [Cyclospora cayetanensis]|uniref:Transmembrane protein n=1 Tax=Cyclospora cayetanensis TaxID=88456 RepID=A0A1D3D8D5_9EIME|nr:hypothetical protein cyc_04450 [Cyclospora cayetanensis]